MKIQIDIDNFGSSGEGVGRWEGKPVFVDGALPGEHVQVKVNLKKKTYFKAQLEKVITPTPDRRASPCPYLPRCGGCQLQHLSYPGQLEAKRAKVQEALRRIGGIEDVDISPCQPSPDEWHYRNKIQIPVKGEKGALRLGLFARGSHELVDIESCLIHCPVGEDAFHVVRDELLASQVGPAPELRHVLIRSAVKTGEVLVVWVSGKKEISSELLAVSNKILKRCPKVKGVVHNYNPKEGNVILGAEWKLLLGRDFIWEELNGLRFKVSPASFFQVNALQAEKLYEKALELASPLANKRVLDAYCGVGTLACFAARHAKEVVGVEWIPQAIEDAHNNAALNGLENTEFRCGATEDLIQQLGEVDTVLLNPPRKGCDPKVLASLIERGVREIVYVSCDPATLSRDLKILTKAGYRVDAVCPYDMFPQTAHVETVAKIVKGS